MSSILYRVVVPDVLMIRIRTSPVTLIFVAVNKDRSAEVTEKVPAVTQAVPLLVLYSTRPAVSASVPYLPYRNVIELNPILVSAFMDRMPVELAVSFDRTRAEYNPLKRSLANPPMTASLMFHEMPLSVTSPGA